MSDRGKDTSWALTEVRTVRSRALTAIKMIPITCGDRDPEEAEMIVALKKVVEILDPWRRA